MRLDSTWANVSVSTGTMREQDLIPAFEDVLRQAGEPLPDRPAGVRKLMSRKRLADGDWDDVSWYLNEELFGALDDIAPDGCYFGSHPGDGCDYGFWSEEEGES
jgi:hypothetical protein